MEFKNHNSEKCGIRDLNSMGRTRSEKVGLMKWETGFQYKRQSDGTMKETDHKFLVRIGKNVTLHPFVQVTRGTERDTIIQDNCKLGPLTHIAHQVEIRFSNLVAPGVCMGGSAVVGEKGFLGLTPL